MQLKIGTLLKGGTYRIERILGQGGFGITYLAFQSGLNRKVALKEFFMKEHCNREGDTSMVTVPSYGSREMVNRFRQKFIKEAQTIAGMDNHHIITLHDIFEENGTAYYVMEYLSCGSLSDRIPSDGLPESEALGYIRQVCDALSYIHENKILHLDIKPSNILFRKADEAVLIDFGISKHYDEAGGSQTSSTPVGVSEGYAPTEQYESEGVSSFSASTDIYSLGATLYCLLTGHRPPKASIVLNDGLPPLPSSVSCSVRGAVESAMSPRRKDRPQSVEKFLFLLDSGSEATVVPPPPPPPPPPLDPKPRKWHWALLVGIVAAVVLFFIFKGGPNPSPDDVVVQADTVVVDTPSSYSVPVAPGQTITVSETPERPVDPLASQWESDLSRYESLVDTGIEYSKNDATLSQAKSKFTDAFTLERKYKGSSYSGQFSKNASGHLKDVEKRQAEIAVADAAARAEAERLAQEEKAREQREREQKEREEAERKRNGAYYSNGILRVKGVEYPMVYVSGGSFDMGATSEQGSDAYNDEKPVHRVTLSSYRMGKYEVTQELWEAVMGSNPSYFKGSRRPVESVSWDACQEFIRKLNALTGHSFRLPTEAEWEFASRGGNSSRGYKYSGSNTIGDVAWYDENSEGQTHNVGSKSPNELGLYDMSGNVWEWCSDWYGSYSSSSQSNPQGPSSGSYRVRSGSYRVHRGGSWGGSAGRCRVSNRNDPSPVDRYSDLGFRLCL